MTRPERLPARPGRRVAAALPALLAVLAVLAAAGCVSEAGGGALRQEPMAPGGSVGAASGPAPPVPRTALPTDPARSQLVGVRWTLVELDGTEQYRNLQSVGAWFLLSGDGAFRFADGINDGSGTYTLTPDGFVTHDVFSSAVGYGGNDPQPYRVMQAMTALVRGATADPTSSGFRLTVHAGGWTLQFQAEGSQPPSPAAGGVAGSVAPQRTPTPEATGLRHPVCTPAQLRGTVARSGSVGLQGFAVVTLTNTGRRTCTLVGYPYVLARDENHLPVRLLHGEGPLAGVADPGPRVVEVAPGGQAWFAAGAPEFFPTRSATIGELVVVPAGLDAAAGGGVTVPVALHPTSDSADFLLVVTAYAPGTPPATP